MAVTAVSVVNGALLRLGLDPISRLDDGTAEAAVASTLYEVTRDSALAGYAWTWASKTVELSALAAPAAPEPWIYWHQLPADFIGLHEVVTPGVAPHFDMMAENRIAANVEGLTIKYVYRVDEAQQPAYFRELVSLRLAVAMNPALVRDNGQLQIHDQQARRAWSMACFNDASSTGLQTLGGGAMLAAR